MRPRNRAGRRGAVVVALVLGSVVAMGCGDDSADEEAAQPSEAPAEARSEVPEPGEGTNAVGATLKGIDEPTAKKTAPPEAEELAKAPGDGSLDCLRGYSLVRAGDRASCETDGISRASGTAQLANNSQRILNGTFQLAKEYAETAIHSNTGDPVTYRYLIYPQDCTMVSGDTGRCLVYFWKTTYATGYGAGGIDTGVFREHFLAAHVGSNTYSTRIVMVDFLDPYYWECSDTPRANTPRCT